MRLWHEDLLSNLPRQQLLGQHRECAALRGNGWGKPHATINYIFDYSPYKLFQYHMLVITEMEERGYHPDTLWKNANYRGKNCLPFHDLQPLQRTHPIYPEHNDAYLSECIQNLKTKGIFL
ncbi:TIGR02328 family protein [Aerococcus suis]